MFCRFGDLEEQMVLHIATKWLKDDNLRKQLLTTPELELVKMKNLCCMFTSAEASNDFLTGSASNGIAYVSRERKLKLAFNKYQNS